LTYGNPDSGRSGFAAHEAAVTTMPEQFDHELVGTLLGRERGGSAVSDISERVFGLFAGRALTPPSQEELRQGCGISDTEAAKLAAAIELARRLLLSDDGQGPIRSPRDACRAVRSIRSADREHFLVLALNARNVVILKETVSIGSLNANIVHPREVFRPAIINGAAALILAHNHPSGDVSPSREDLSLTQRLVDAGRLLGIDVLDHIIVSGRRYLSFRSENYL
jgi:DNA repair protein RadC